jgi:hypothetical protein
MAKGNLETHMSDSRKVYQTVDGDAAMCMLTNVRTGFHTKLHCMTKGKILRKSLDISGTVVIVERVRVPVLPAYTSLTLVEKFWSGPHMHPQFTTSSWAIISPPLL